MELSNNFASLPIGGVQSVGRAVAVLKFVADAHAGGGARLVDLVVASGLAKPTAHRLLKELVDSGLLMRDGERRYRLGQAAYEIGVAASTTYQVQDLCRQAVDELARSSGETVYLAVRSGADAFCIECVSNHRAPWSSTYARGSRVALGAGACGLALFSFLRADERADLLTKNASRLSRYSSLESLTLRADATRLRGYAITDSDVVKGVTAVGVPILDRLGHPIAALSIAMPTCKFTEACRGGALRSLLAEAHGLREALILSCAAAEGTGVQARSSGARS